MAWNAATATAAEIDAYHGFRVQLARERYPEEPPPARESVERRVRTGHPRFLVRRWLALEAGAPVGSVTLSCSRTEENAHIAEVRLAVLPAWRGRGLGRALLRECGAPAAAEGRTHLFLATTARIPEGERFARAAGGAPALLLHTSELHLQRFPAAELAAVLEGWIARVPQRAAGFALEWWPMPYPRRVVEDAAHMRRAVADAPRGGLLIVPFRYTGELLLREDEALRARGVRRWSLCARDPAGRAAGFTEVFWQPDRPDLARQGDTAVFPEYRNRGIGRWLKAEMLRHLLAERPEVQRMRTQMAGDNGPMQRINAELGYSLYEAITLWQIPVTSVLPEGGRS